MRTYPEFRLQIRHSNKWLVITHAWELDALTDQINFYKNKKQIFRVQRLINGQYK